MRISIFVILAMLLTGMISFGDCHNLGMHDLNSSTVTGTGLVGSGTAADPYMIYDVYDLQNINNDLKAHYALAKDIDATVTYKWNEGAGFEPLGPGPHGNHINYFQGTIDGRNHIITGLFIDRLNEDHIGLFATLDWTATVKNLGLLDYNITGGNRVGALAGYNEGTIYNTFSNGNITGISTVGGLVGWNNYGTVKNSYAAGNTIGLCCGGGLIGGNSRGTIENSFYDRETTDRSDTGRGDGKTTSQMMDMNTFADASWDIIAVDDLSQRNTNHTWNIVNHETYPFLSGMTVSVIEYTLLIEVIGQGSTSPSPGTHIFTKGHEVRVSAIPDDDWEFSHWSTELSETGIKDNQTHVLLDRDMVLTAHFIRALQDAPPTIQIIYPEKDSILDGDSILLRWNSEEGTHPIAYYEVRLNDGIWLDMGLVDSYTLLDLEDGENEVRVKVVDGAGNEVTASRLFFVETTEQVQQSDKEFTESDQDDMVLSSWILLPPIMLILAVGLIFAMRKSKYRGHSKENSRR